MIDLDSALFQVPSPACYQICVAGSIDPEWADYLQGMEFSAVEQKDGAESTFTVLSGRLPDQAALMSVLWQLYNLGVSLVSVRCIQESWEEELDKIH